MRPIILIVFFLFSCVTVTEEQASGPALVTMEPPGRLNSVPPSYHFVPAKRAFVVTGGPSDWYECAYYSASGQVIKRRLIYCPSGNIWPLADRYAKKNNIRYKRVGCRRVNHQYLRH